MHKIPKQFHPLFWDYNANTLDTGKYKSFIIERILEKGTKESVIWILNSFPHKDIRNVLLHSTNLTERTTHFWNLILNERDSL